VGEYRFTQLQRPAKPLFVVRVVENVALYVETMRQLFDFKAIQRLLDRSDFRMTFDAMYGAAGPYASAIFGEELGGKVALQHCEPRADFNGLHPDPNLECAKDLV
jgi:phosphoglucomutase